MTFRRLKKVNSSSGAASPDGDGHFPSSQSDSSRSSEVYSHRSLAYCGGTLPRNYRKSGGMLKWKPVAPSPEAQRKVVSLEKKEEETFGFEIQTYGLHHHDHNSVEMCTFVCRVHGDSPAQQAGLRVGDTISCVNEATVEGFRHKEIVQLIRACGNTLRLETLYSDAIRKAELEARLQYLKQTLHEKWDEYRSLMVQEQRLLHGIVMSDAAIYESLESAGVYGSVGAPSPAPRRALRCSGSSGSSVSLISAAAAAAEDEPLYQSCPYRVDGETRDAAKDPAPRRRLRLRPASELFSTAKTQLTRSASTRSYLRGASPSGDKQGGGLGSLQRKSKPKSFRRRILKFIPGLNRPLEEEESKL